MLVFFSKVHMSKALSLRVDEPSKFIVITTGDVGVIEGE